METSLNFDSKDKRLKLFAKERFTNDDNYVLTVRPTQSASAPPHRIHPSPSHPLFRGPSGLRRLHCSNHPNLTRISNSIPPQTAPFFFKIALTTPPLPTTPLPPPHPPPPPRATTGVGVAGHEGRAGGEQGVRAQKVLPGGGAVAGRHGQGLTLIIFPA